MNTLQVDMGMWTCQWNFTIWLLIGCLDRVLPSPTRMFEADHTVPLLKAGVNPDDIVQGSTFDAEGECGWGNEMYFY